MLLNFVRWYFSLGFCFCVHSMNACNFYFSKWPCQVKNQGMSASQNATFPIFWKLF